MIHIARFISISQQQAIRALFVILISAGLLFAAVGLIQGDWSVIVIASSGLLIDLALLLAYLRGWRYAPLTLALLMTAFVNLALQSGTDSARGLFWAFLPIVIALILTDTVWTGLVATITLVIQLLGPVSGATYWQPEVLVGYLVITVGLLVSRLILEHALTDTRQNAQRARQETNRATAALALAEQRADELAQQSITQQRLLDTIATLETPTITLADGVLLVPLVGHIDASRAQRLLSQLVHAAHQSRARHVILDITGVPLIENAGIEMLIQIVQALQLLGCTVTMSGIRVAIATFLADRTHALAGIRVAANLQQAIQPKSYISQTRN
ncbi:MAG: STAS domain-containing protein [Blastochloris sp.]|nr:STAS domain-containing protein [Blastochloris sp.]